MQRKTRLECLLVGLALLLCPVGAVGGDFEKEADDGLDVYFRDTGLESLAKQEAAAYSESDAGESKKFDRLFPDAPPQIPHTVEDIFPLTASDNECIDCHHPENAVGPEDVPIPTTHFKRAVMAKGSSSDYQVWLVKGYEEGEELAGSRYHCNMCHTPQAANAKTIKSSFQRVKGKPTQ
jgi:nitrate reductase cytochrome c-type subunit